MESRFDLVHVGKCGGVTVATELRRNNIEFNHIHVTCKPEYHPLKQYLVLVRDPVERFVSCYNWRRYLLENQLLKPKGSFGTLKIGYELEFIRRFNDVNEIAQALTGEEETPIGELLYLIGHVRRGFSWYLDKLLDSVQPGQIRGLIGTKTLTNDMSRLFGLQVTCHDKGNYPKKSVELTDRSRAVLRCFFSNEYATLERLKRMVPEEGHVLSFL